MDFGFLYLTLVPKFRFCLTYPHVFSFASSPFPRGCLTQEKIVAGNASRFIVIADFRYDVQCF